jgi:formyl-CoA transferase
MIGEMTAPLKDIRVLELGTMITAPLAGMMLADLGADVIKLENPEGGDPFRNFAGGSYSPNFIAYNHGKRSIALDLRADAGRRAFAKLLETADVLLENVRPGVLARLGFPAERIAGINPRLIHCSITGFGATGPYSNRPAFDTVGIALSGIASLSVDPDHPKIAGPTIADNAAGLYAATGILAALQERHRTDKGARVEINMLEAAISFIPDPIAHQTQLGVTFGPLTRVAASQTFAFRCADDRLLSLHLSIPEKFWRGLVAAIARPDLASHPLYDSRPNRVKNYLALSAELAAIFACHPRPYWMELLDTNDVPFAPIQTTAEILVDPQVQHLETFVQTTHPTEGAITAICRPILIDGQRARPTAPPTLGQHTAEILRELDET